MPHAHAAHQDRRYFMYVPVAVFATEGLRSANVVDVSRSKCSMPSAADRIATILLVAPTRDWLDVRRIDVDFVDVWI